MNQRLFLIALFSLVVVAGCDKQQTSSTESAVAPEVAANADEKAEEKPQEAEQEAKKEEECAATKDNTDEKPFAPGEEVSENPVLKVGDLVPDVTVASDNEGDVSLRKLVGQKYILYFYPKDESTGCTVQANDFKELYSKYEDKGYKIYGISPDSVESHAGFRKNHGLQFTLLSDPDHQMAEAFGVWRERERNGEKFMGIIRSTFVVDDQGHITQLYDNVRPTGHAVRILEKI